MKKLGVKLLPLRTLPGHSLDSLLDSPLESPLDSPLDSRPGQYLAKSLDNLLDSPMDSLLDSPLDMPSDSPSDSPSVPWRVGQSYGMYCLSQTISPLVPNSSKVLNFPLLNSGDSIQSHSISSISLCLVRGQPKESQYRYM